ncbi:hypothetical protein [Nocardia miyunensis]|uniref:hypothetical protein n=1 Tax=Nocardia miyunensis TaxID=282684 RepID=UPI000834D71F|nr:hypothetical protein [Nocardia miyunensis]
MTDARETYDPPQDTGTPDAVETDPGALNSAEDLDEDRLRQDPLERAMDPPEHWSGVDKYGMTASEQARARPLAERLAEEEPDLTGAATAPQLPEQDDPDRDSEQEDLTADLRELDTRDLVPHTYAEDLGTAADEPGGPEQTHEQPG